MSSFKRITCRLCASYNLELVFKLAPTPPADAYVGASEVGKKQEVYPLDLYFCRDCGLTQLLEVVSPEEIYLKYKYETSRSPGLSEHYRDYADWVIKKFGIPEKSFVVDIGCNDGTLLKFFKIKNIRVLGIDPASKVAEKGSSEGVEILTEFFTPALAYKIKRERGAADVITANNVMANIDDLDEFVSGIHDLLSPEGIFVFETGYLVDMVNNSVFDNIYHEHISYFSVKPLLPFFSRHDMEFIDIERVPTKGGSIRGVVQRIGAKRRPSGSIKKIISLEEKNGFGDAGTLKDFAKRIDGIRKELVGVLDKYRKDGKRVAGYGASHSVTTMIFQFGIADNLDFLVDDNPLKQNRFSPGFHIPVMNPNVIYERKPDYILILPWRFSKPIIDRHSKYANGGGRFIVPLPKVEII